MKAISIYPQSVAVNELSFPVLKLYADSAIGRDVMPLFVPDIPIGWSCRICVAIRIIKLGKNIAPKFASRYVDAIGLVNLLQPQGDDSAARVFEMSGGLQILDSAVTTGQWHECNVSELSSIDIDINGNTYTFWTEALSIPDRVSDVSRLATLKTGDIIILEDTAITMPLGINTVISCKINGNACLNIKIK